MMTNDNKELIGWAQSELAQPLVNWEDPVRLVDELLAALMDAEDELDKALGLIASGFITARAELDAAQAEAKAEALEEAARYISQECFYTLARPAVAIMLTSHADEYRALGVSGSTS